MNPDDMPDTPRSRQLQSVIARFLEAEQRGERPNRQQMLVAHPQLADALIEFFEQHDRRRMARSSSPGNEDVTVGSVPAGSMLGEAMQYYDRGDVGSESRSPAESPTIGSSDEPSFVGQRVRYFGDYQLLDEVARGGMGVVYKARQINLNRVVALKMILAGELAGEDEVQRFKSEAEAAAQLDHPGIVPIFEIGEHCRQHYFSMGFVEGQSLADRLRDGPLPPREAAELVAKISEAVAYAHDKGVIHRDLKPANVLIDTDGQPRVTDFGLAKRVEADSELTRTGQVIGTPAYMPPEQAAGRLKDIGPRSDVYALGAILYAALSGRPPFQSASLPDTLIQVLERDPLPPRQLTPETPRDLETICLKCLRKEPQKRYGSARELTDELRRFLKGEPIVARRIHPLIRAARQTWHRHRAVTAAALAVSLALLCVALGWIGWEGYDAWRRGEVTFQSTSQQTIVEIRRLHTERVLSEEGDEDEVLARVATPMFQPLSLPSGDYSIRLRSENYPSEHWRLFVPRGIESEVRLTPGQQFLWPAISPAAFDLIKRQNGIFLLIRDGDSLRLHDAATGELSWRVIPDLRATPKLRAPAALGIHHGAQLGMYATANGGDFNGDAMEDLLLHGTGDGRRVAAIAISGKTGETLWRKEVGPDVLAKRSLSGPMYTWDGKEQLGAPLVMDLNSDAVPDVVWPSFAWREEPNYQTIGDHSARTIQAVSGTDGELLWTASLDNDWFRFEIENPDRFALDVLNKVIRAESHLEWKSPGTPELLEINGQQRLVAAAGSRIVLLDPATGQQDGLPIDTGHMIIRPLRFFDGEDQAPQALAVVHSGQAPRIVRDEAILPDSLSLWSLSERRRQWTTADEPPSRDRRRAQYGTGRLGGRFQFPNRATSTEWPLLADLTGDAVPEILLPVSEDPWDGLCLETRRAETGEVLWATNFGKQAFFGDVAVHPGQRPLVQLVVGDVMGRGVITETDGTPELLTLEGGTGREVHRVGVGGDSSVTDPERYGTFTDLFASPITDHEGWPLIFLRQHSSSGNATLLVSTRTGEVIDHWPSLAIQTVVDLHQREVRGKPTGDAVPEIVAHTRHGVIALPLVGAERWRRLGNWQPADDYDADGVHDLASVPKLGGDDAQVIAAVSGLTGDLLWHFRDNVRLLHPLPNNADVNQDGVPDLLLMDWDEGEWTGTSAPFDACQLRAVSGSDGDILWSGSIELRSESGGSSRRPVQAAAGGDLDGDAVPDLVVAANLRNDPLQENESASALLPEERTCAWIAISGRTGRQLWQHKFAADRESYNTNPPPPPRFDDLDGDGQDDLVVAVPLPRDSKSAVGDWEICQIDGRTGEVVQQTSFGGEGSPTWHYADFGSSGDWGESQSNRWITSDLDGNGTAEVLVLDSAKKRVVALDGGVVVWEVEFPAEFRGTPEGLVTVDFDTSVSGRDVVVWGGNGHFLQIKSGGNSEVSQGPYESVVVQLTTVQLPAGNEVLIAVHSTEAQSLGKDLKPLWTTQFIPPDEQTMARFDGFVRLVAPDKAGPPVLILGREGGELTIDDRGRVRLANAQRTGFVGINLESGELLWKVQLPASTTEKPHLLFGDHPAEPPGYIVKSMWTDSVAGVICRDALPLAERQTGTTSETP